MWNPFRKAERNGKLIPEKNTKTKLKPSTTQPPGPDSSDLRAQEAIAEAEKASAASVVLDADAFTRLKEAEKKTETKRRQVNAQTVQILAETEQEKGKVAP